MTFKHLRALAIGLALVAAGATRGLAQESRLHAEFRVEAEHIKDDCSALKKAPSCAATLVTDHPLHISLGSIAPQNGFGAGPALNLHFTPSESWRNTWSSDAVVATSGAWRAGTYFKAIHTNVELPTVVTGGGAPARPIRITEYPIFSAYAQAISLPDLAFYGIGPDSSAGNKAAYRMAERIVGGAAVVPLRHVAPAFGAAVLAEANGRFFDIPGALHSGPEPAFLQLGEGVRLKPFLFNDRLRLNYTVQLQQFLASQADSSFRRWTVNLNHEIPIYRSGGPTLRRETNVPNDCSVSPSDRHCAPVTRDRWGTLAFRLLASKSQVGDGAAVPFYLQRTLGGSDIDGNRALASYADYRFRGPHLVLLQETFEHSIWGPLGVLLQAEQGRVASQTEGLGFGGLRHSTTIGATLRAGGFPVVTAAWSTGGREGSRVIVTMDTSLLGGGARPALQ